MKARVMVALLIADRCLSRSSAERLLVAWERRYRGRLEQTAVPVAMDVLPSLYETGCLGDEELTVDW